MAGMARVTEPWLSMGNIDSHRHVSRRRVRRYVLVDMGLNYFALLRATSLDHRGVTGSQARLVNDNGGKSVAVTLDAQDPD